MDAQAALLRSGIEPLLSETDGTQRPACFRQDHLLQYQKAAPQLLAGQFFLLLSGQQAENSIQQEQCQRHAARAKQNNLIAQLEKTARF